mgnify:FL=1
MVQILGNRGVPFGMVDPKFQTAGRSRFLDKNELNFERPVMPNGGPREQTMFEQSRNTGIGGLENLINRDTQPEIDLKSRFTDVDNKELKAVGENLFSPEGMNVNFDGLNEKEIISMATDKKEKVAPKALALYDSSNEVAKIIGALTKMSTGGKKVDDLYQTLIKEGTASPEKAKKQVNEFFKVDPNEETPAWADAAIAIGQSLLSGDPSQTGLQSLGTALGAGGIAAKAKTDKTKAKKSAMDQLAFGVYREDKKSQKALMANYEKFKQKQVENTDKLGVRLTDLLYKDKKFNQDEQKNIAQTITATVNTFPKKGGSREALFQAIVKNKDFLKGVDIPNIGTAIYALAKENGIDTVETEASSIVKAEVKINDENQFNFFKEKFPNQFEGFETYDPTKSYTVRGFTNKTVTGNIQDNISQVSVSSNNLSPTKTGFLAVLEEKGNLQKAIALEKDPTKRGILQSRLATIQDKINKDISLPDNSTQLKKSQLDLQALQKQRATVDESGETPNGVPVGSLDKQILETQGRIDKLTKETPANIVYMSPDGDFYSGPAGFGGLDERKNKALITKIENQQVAFVRAAGIGDAILYNLSKESGTSGVGVFEKFGNLIQGAFAQGSVIASTMTSDERDRYNSGNIDNLISENSGKTSKIFAKFKKASGVNQNLMSAIMDYAFALAGSRETGKLTDKDIASAIETMGGGDFAAGDWFTNSDKLISGVSNALQLSSNNLGVKMNQQFSKTRKMEEKKGNQDLDQFFYDPLRLIKRLAPDNTLYQRLYVGKTDFVPNGLSYQKFNKYQKMHGIDPNLVPPPEADGTNTLNPELTIIKNKIATFSQVTDNTGKILPQAEKKIIKLYQALPQAEQKLIRDALK